MKNNEERDVLGIIVEVILLFILSGKAEWLLGVTG